MRAIRVAVVGAGILGRRHARVFAEIDGAQLVAVADHSLERATAAASPAGAQAFTSIEAALENVDCDVVSVATPDHLHLQPALIALEAGKHVLVEKPLATSVADAHALIAAAEQRRLVLQVNYSQRWVSEYAWIKQQIDAGVIGRPVMVQSSKMDTIYVPTRMISWAASTSPIWFMSSHDLDLICWFLDDRVVEVTAREQRGVLESKGIGAHDGVDAVLRFSRGATLALHSSWILPETYPAITVDRMSIVGERGVIEFESSGRRVACYDARGGKVINFTGPQTANEVNGRIEGAFRQSLLSFLACVEGAPEAMTSARRTLHVTEIQEAILRAASGTETEMEKVTL